MKTVSNSGPIIALSRIKLLKLLHKLCGTIIVPKAVWIELAEKGKGRSGCEEIASANWIVIQDARDRLSIEILLRELDLAEAETIILAKEVNADLLLVDDHVARRIAKDLGLRVAGTVAIVVEAWRRGVLKRNPIEVIMEMRAKGVWLSDELIDKVRKIISTK